MFPMLMTSTWLRTKTLRTYPCAGPMVDVNARRTVTTRLLPKGSKSCGEQEVKDTIMVPPTKILVGHTHCYLSATNLNLCLKSESSKDWNIDGSSTLNYDAAACLLMEYFYRTIWLSLVQSGTVWYNRKQSCAIKYSLVHSNIVWNTLYGLVQSCSIRPYTPSPLGFKE